MPGFIQRRLEPHADAILGAYAAGASFDEIAGSFGCSGGTIRRFLLSHEVALRPAVRKRKLDPHRTEVIDAYRAGIDVGAIALRFQVQPQTVRTYLFETASRG